MDCGGCRRKPPRAWAQFALIDGGTSARRATGRPYAKKERPYAKKERLYGNRALAGHAVPLDQ